MTVGLGPHPGLVCGRPYRRPRSDRGLRRQVLRFRLGGRFRFGTAVTVHEAVSPFLQVGFHVLPPVIWPGISPEVAQTDLLPVEEYFRKDIPGAAHGLEKHHLDVGCHRRPECLEIIDKVVRIGGRLIEAVDVHYHLQRHHHMVVTVAEMGSAHSGGKGLGRLRDHVVHYRRAGGAVGMIFPETLIVVDFPKGGELFLRKESVHVHPFRLGQRSHAGDEHVEMEENGVGIPLPESLVRVLEYPCEDVPVPGETPQEKLFRGFTVREHALRTFVPERIAAHVGAGGLEVRHALMLVDFHLGSQPGDGTAAGRHAQDGPDRRRGAGIHETPFPENGGICLDHLRADPVILLPSQRGKVSDTIPDILPERDHPLLQGLAVGGKVACLQSFKEHVVYDAVGIPRVGIAGAVAAVMADVDRLVAFRGRGQVFL